MKNQTKDFYEPPERRHYKKKYVVRKHEELEVSKEIKEYENHKDESGTPTDQRNRPGRGECGKSEFS